MSLTSHAPWRGISRLGPLMLAVLWVGAAHAWDFTYGFSNVTESIADTYIVQQQNVRKYVEWQSPPETYWGAPASGIPGAVTMRFDFPGPTTQVYLKAELLSANHSSYYGATSLWASKDGANWQLLLDNPVPSEMDSEKVYAQTVPESLLGASSFWVQARLQQWNSGPTISDAQFARSDPAISNSVFELKANYGKAGGLFAAHAESATGRPEAGGRWPLFWAMLALAVALFGALCALAALICALIGLSNRKPTAVRALHDRLTLLDQRLSRLEQASPRRPIQ